MTRRDTMDEKILALLLGPNFAHVATARADGSPSVTPTWVDWRDDHVLLNSTPGRAWVKNLTRDPRVTLSVSAVDNPYECATIRGHMVATTTDGAEEHFTQLFAQYRNRPMPFGDDGDEPDSQDPDRRELVLIAVDSTHYQWQPGPGASEEYDAFLAQIMNPPTAPATTGQD
ncbi:PPOX class F420-dependent oxidoreductase [Pseudonocardia sp. TMWB2A]|uniref:PPOX class F420-dependent oxidoreductase n=1 Tax=Pseudonocardia sp. TMWB2A TaxID=687430 RepID=UPI00307F4600